MFSGRITVRPIEQDFADRLLSALKLLRLFLLDFCLSGFPSLFGRCGAFPLVPFLLYGFLPIVFLEGLGDFLACGFF